LWRSGLPPRHLRPDQARASARGAPPRALVRRHVRTRRPCQRAGQGSRRQSLVIENAELLKARSLARFEEVDRIVENARKALHSPWRHGHLPPDPQRPRSLSIGPLLELDKAPAGMMSREVV